jgi:hypothetical protein
MKLFKIFREKPEETQLFPPEEYTPVIRSSICTGEKVAGFKDKTGGHFTEVMLISTPEDEATFMTAFGLSSVKREY